MTNILIGVGGTGAKIVEACLVLAAAGLGPRSLHVGLVDQDSSNGNVTRTKRIVASYREMRQRWSGAASANHIEWPRDPNGSEAFHFCRTDVKELFGNEVIWCPGGDQTNLRNSVGVNLDDRQKALFDLLFMPGEEEQELSLAEGYRGRAHVGAAALISRLTDPRNPLTENLVELMSGGGGREQVNIFIAGSAFGGTGAAGFPTIARELHRIRSAQEFTNKGQVAIGGALMLPYFGFASPDADESHLVVATDELLPKAQLALEYYGNLFDSEPAFDRFYLIGWEKFFNLGYHEAGNQEQQNPPLLPELFAATAALHFLNEGADLLNPTTSAERVKVSSRTGHDVRWDDFPLPNIKERLGQLLRFAIYWRYVVRDLIEARRPLLGKGNWTQRLTEKNDKEEALGALQALDTFVEAILTFAASMEYASGNDWNVGPWRLGTIANSTHQASPTDPVRILSAHSDGAEIFSDVVRNADGTTIMRDAAEVYDQLETDETLTAGAHKGLGRVVAAAYRASRIDTKEAQNAAAE